MAADRVRGAGGNEGDTIRRAQKGGRAELEELFRRELPPLRTWAFANVPAAVRRSGGTDDLVQITLLRTLRRLPHLSAAANGTLQPYLRRVFKNLVRDYSRAAGRMPPIDPLEDWDTQDTRSPLGAMLAAEAYARYRHAVSRLSPRAQRALAARLEEGLDYGGVARVAPCASPAAARALVGRALERVVAEIRAHDGG
jgi:RNA polymerase sigma factor (sigma-70 family)